MNTLVRLHGHLYGQEEIDKTYCYISAEGADIEAFISRINKSAPTGYYYTIAETTPTEAQPIGLITMCNMKSNNPAEYNKIIAPLIWRNLSEAEAIRRMNDLIIAKGYTEAQAYKEVRTIENGLN